MNEKPLLILTIDAALLKRIDDYRFKHRFPARSTAIKFLVDSALKFNPKPEAADLIRDDVKSRAKRRAEKEKK